MENIFKVFVLVMRSTLEARVHEEYAIVGNEAFVKCHLPNFESQYLIIDAWILSEENETLIIREFTQILGEEIITNKITDTLGRVHLLKQLQ